MTFTLHRLRSNSARPPLGHLGWLRGACGGTIGVAAAGAASSAILGTNAPALPWIVAPIGASAVLVFAVPASPLAQPWSVAGGSIISALLGLVIGHLVGAPIPAAALALGLAIAAMSIARCLHPPGGACALLYALGAAGPEHWDAAHLLTIMANVIALTCTGWMYNNLTGHSWPHRPAQIPATLARPAHAATVHQALTEVLAEWDEVIDADVDDLDAIFLAVERRVRSREQNAPLVAD